MSIAVDMTAWEKDRWTILTQLTFGVFELDRACPHTLGLGPNHLNFSHINSYLFLFRLNIIMSLLHTGKHILFVELAQDLMDACRFYQILMPL